MRRRLLARKQGVLTGITSGAALMRHLHLQSVRKMPENTLLLSYRIPEKGTCQLLCLRNHFP